MLVHKTQDIGSKAMMRALGTSGGNRHASMLSHQSNHQPSVSPLHPALSHPDCCWWDAGAQTQPSAVPQALARSFSCARCHRAWGQAPVQALVLLSTACPGPAQWPQRSTSHKPPTAPPQSSVQASAERGSSTAQELPWQLSATSTGSIIVTGIRGK